MPISGGAFVNQLAVCAHLGASGYAPTCVFGSSGGNVAAYITLAAEWNWAAIERVTRELSGQMFARPWHSICSVAFAQAYNKGYMYNNGTGVEAFYEYHFTPSSITGIEVWTGTQNVETQRAALFCNRASSALDLRALDQELYGACEPIFCSGDVALIARVSVASASIPSVVPPVVIEGKHYVDGGVCSASPLSTLAACVGRTCADRNEECHIVYACPCNLHGSADAEFGNLVSNSKRAARDVVRSQTILDRAAAHGLVVALADGREVVSAHFTVDAETEREMQRLCDRHRYSLREYYPRTPREVNILSFSGEAAVRMMKEAQADLCCQVWYACPK